MKIRAIVTALALVNTLAAPALAGQGTPGSPPPGTGILTPYNSDREASPAEFPSASISDTLQCAGQGGSTLVNGASVPNAPTPAAPVSGLRSAAAPAIVNGAAVPTIVSPGNDPTWCEGAYRADVGTNFGE